MTKPLRIRTDADALAYLAAAGCPQEAAVEQGGQLYFERSARCLRCNGRGFSGWRVDGGRCYECLGENTEGRVRYVSVKSVARAHKANATRAANIAARVAENEERSARAQAEFLAAHPGLREALTVDHDITRDLAAQLRETGSLTDKQVALALKLAAPKVEEAHVPAPVGRVTFTGRVVSVKEHESDWGTTQKMVVKVATEAGVWLAWGTAKGAQLGDTVEVTATLTPGREAHFAFFKRPKVQVVEAA